MSISAAETGAIFFHTASNCVGLLANFLLLYLVIRKTPKGIKTYSVLMFNFALTDFCGCLMAIFVQQRLIPVGLSLAYISSGPCKHFGGMVCYISYSAMLHCYAHSLWSLLLSFLYRFYVLKSRNPSRENIIIILLCFYSISFFQFISFCFASDDPQEMMAILRSKFPNYDLEGHAITGSKNILEWKALFTILHMTLPVSPVYITIISIRQKIINTLNVHKMSENTKAMHKQLLNALTFQAILPGLFLIAVITYAFGQLGIYNHPILEYTTFLSVGFLPVISPLGTLYFVRPYNNWLKRNILRRNVIDPTQSVYSTTNAPSKGQSSTTKD